MGFTNLSILGAQKAKEKQFNNIGIFSIEDLLKYLPKKYLDYRIPREFKSLKEGENVSVVGVLSEIKLNKLKKYLSASLVSSSGEKVAIMWFHQDYLASQLHSMETYIVCGKLSKNKFNNKLLFTNPIISADIKKYQRIVPVYKKITGMSDDYLKESIHKALNLVNRNEYLEPEVVVEYSVCREFEMARYIHEPQTFEEIAKAEERLIFDALFELSFGINYESIMKNHTSNIVCDKANCVKDLCASLPFSLTDGVGGQLHVTREIFKKLKSGNCSHSLVQGDVGSGKTLVAMLLMLIMAENGYQSVLMAPTNVLALQHYKEFSERLAIFPWIKVVFLNSSMKKKDKLESLSLIESGEATLAIGTHALLSDEVNFKNLGMSIVDEEHRFGVAQRGKLLLADHHVTMSATPIPRSLGLSLYGPDTDIYTITQMPAGRKKIETMIKTKASDAYTFLLEKVNSGQQAYVVCPLIEESASERLKGVDSVEETLAEIKKCMPTSVRVGMINGKMKQVLVSEEIDKFSNNEYDILVSTTIVEVGVNVPNSNVIIVKNAERFGLAQLHQLRGRVGRGHAQGYCLLVSRKDDVERLDLMTKTNDGFEIAQKDLELRGMGDFIGTKQTGEYKNVMLMMANPDLYEKIKVTVKEIVLDSSRMKYYEQFIVRLEASETSVE